MKASKLRCGNLVYAQSVHKGRYQNYILNKKKIVIVESILDLVEYGGKINNNHDSWDYDLENVNGIDLTEEWLLKFGFEQSFEDEENNSIFINGAFEVTKHCFKSEFWMDLHLITPNRIRYVHQLQNLYFVLTGNELIIKEPAS